MANRNDAKRLPKESLTAGLRARLLKREREEALLGAALDAQCHTFTEGLDFGWQDTEEPEPPKRIYLAGPMRGYDLYNFPAFDKAARALRAKGFKVVSPHELDLETGFDPAGTLEGFSIEDAVRRDAEAITKVDAVYVLPGWQNSKGAKAEAAIATWLGKPVYDFETGEVIPDPVNATDSADVLQEAYRLTTGDRNAQYGPPTQDFQRIAGMLTSLFSDLLKPGAAFQPYHVAMVQVCVKLSRQLHQRKRDNWVDIAGYARCGNLCDEAAERASEPSKEATDFTSFL